VPDYWYKALTGSGAVQEGWMTAPSEVDVEAALRQQGSFLVQTEQRDRPRRITDAVVDRRELLAFLEYLAASFTAGVPLLTTLDDIPQRLRSAKLKTIVTEVRTAVSEEGKSLSEAMADHPKAFPALFIATIKAGEASGHLGFALQQLVEYLDWQENISSSVRQATMYPMVVITAVTLLVVGLVGFVFPRIIPVLRTRDVELPLPTKIIMAMSSLIRDHWGAVLAIIAILVVTFLVLKRSERGRLWIDTLIVRTPGVGPFVVEVNMARVVTYLSLFYRSGVDLMTSLLLVEQMATNKVIANLVRDARLRIEGGETMASAFGRSPLVPIIVLRSLALGESTGQLEESLERAKVYYSREIPAAVKRVVTLIQPAMIVVLGGVILMVALAIMLPILNIYNSIGVRR
jgi:type IV pilus assembly protein PilC